VSAGEKFHKDLNDALAFDLQLEPNSRSYPVGEWTIAVSPRQPENDFTEFVSVVNGPYCYHNDLMIDMSYGYCSRGRGLCFVAQIQLRDQLQRLQHRIQEARDRPLALQLDGTGS
jgi:hypothetical protein